MTNIEELSFSYYENEYDVECFDVDLLKDILEKNSKTLKHLQLYLCHNISLQLPELSMLQSLLIQGWDSVYNFAKHAKNLKKITFLGADDMTLNYEDLKSIEHVAWHVTIFHDYVDRRKMFRPKFRWTFDEAVKTAKPQALLWHNTGPLSRG